MNEIHEGYTFVRDNDFSNEETGNKVVQIDYKKTFTLEYSNVLYCGSHISQDVVESDILSLEYPQVIRDKYTGETFIYHRPVVNQHGLHAGRNLAVYLQHAPSYTFAKVQVWGNVSEYMDIFAGEKMRILSVHEAECQLKHGILLVVTAYMWHLYPQYRVQIEEQYQRVREGIIRGEVFNENLPEEIRLFNYLKPQYPAHDLSVIWYWLEKVLRSRFIAVHPARELLDSLVESLLDKDPFSVSPNDIQPIFKNERVYVRGTYV